MRFVTDANIWIDFYEAGLLGKALGSGDEWVTPNVILHEVSRPAAAVLTSLGLSAAILPGGLTAEIPALAARYPRPSPQDLSALVLARAEGLVLVTGDRALREAAETEGVEVHGTLWLLDRMVASGAVTEREAAAGLKAMMQAARRLPKDEVERRLRRWAR